MEIPPPQCPSFPFVPLIPKQHLKVGHRIRGWWSGGPGGYRLVGTDAVGDKRITFLAETLSKLQFLVLHSPSTLSTSRNV
jgi:hypothetical protein